MTRQLALGLLLGHAVVGLPAVWFLALPARCLLLVGVGLVLFDAAVLLLVGRMARRAGAVVALLLAAVTPAVAQDRTRVDLFKPDGTRAGYAVVDQQSGRVDYYDVNSRRTGYGTVDASGRVERFDARGRRETGTVVPPARGQTR